MNKYIALLFLLLSIGCVESSTNDKKNIEIDLDQRTSISIFDIFSKIEIIPLETTSLSLIKEIYKVIDYENHYFILDSSLSQIFIFDEKGNFINKINDRGEGPDQYINISDFTIDKTQKQIVLLSSVNNSLYYYDLNTRFITKRKIPIVDKGAYKSFCLLNKDTIALWGFDYDYRIKYYSIDKDKIIYKAFPEKRKDIFCPYEFQMDGYLCRSLNNKVYKLSFPLEVSYQWDFGKYNNDLSKIEFPQPPNSQSIKKYAQDVYSSKIANYTIALHGQNSQYKFCQIIRENKPINIFHNILDTTSFVFEKTQEGACLYPIYWNENWIISTNQIVSLNDILPVCIQDSCMRDKIQALKEDDNPVLIKHIFKR